MVVRSDCTRVAAFYKIMMILRGGLEGRRKLLLIYEFSFS